MLALVSLFEWAGTLLAIPFVPFLQNNLVKKHNTFEFQLMPAISFTKATNDDAGTCLFELSFKYFKITRGKRPHPWGWLLSLLVSRN